MGDLEGADPLRRTFELAETAENYKNGSYGVSELTKYYEELENDLDVYAHGILTQCSNMSQVKTLVEHKPEDQKTKRPEGKKTKSQKEQLFLSHPSTWPCQREESLSS